MFDWLSPICLIYIYIHCYMYISIYFTCIHGSIYIYIYVLYIYICIHGYIYIYNPCNPIHPHVSLLFNGTSLAAVAAARRQVAENLWDYWQTLQESTGALWGESARWYQPVMMFFFVSFIMFFIVYQTYIYIYIYIVSSQLWVGLFFKTSRFMICIYIWYICDMLSIYLYIYMYLKYIYILYMYIWSTVVLALKQR